MNRGSITDLTIPATEIYNMNLEPVSNSNNSYKASVVMSREEVTICKDESVFTLSEQLKLECNTPLLPWKNTNSVVILIGSPNENFTEATFSINEKININTQNDNDGIETVEALRISLSLCLEK